MVQQVVIPSLSLKVTTHGRTIHERTVSAANVKKLYIRPESLRHSFQDEVSQLTWEADSELAEAIASVPPLYTLTDRKVVLGPESSWV